MKRTLAFFLLLAAVVPCSAQWQVIEKGGLLLAFAQRDTSLFVSHTDPGEILRYIPTGAPNAHWAGASNGIDFTQGDVTSFASLGRYFFAGMTHSDGSHGPIYRSADNGSLWQYDKAAGPVVSNGTYLFGNSLSSVYRSRDSGNSWQGVACPLASNFAAIGACIIAAVSNSVQRSLDSGTTWSQISTPITNLKTFAFIGSLTFAANGPIIRSTDSGSNWTQLSLTANTSRLASSGPYLFAGTDSGVYVSLDSGNTWRQENDGLGKYYQVNSLCVFDTLLFVNTALGFPYYTAMRPIREMVDTTKSAVAAGPVPQDTLSIYPNPATGLVTIFAGTIPIERVSVLNLLGVGVLNSPNPHTSELTLDLSELPSGTYILQIMTAKGTILRKVIRE